MTEMQTLYRTLHQPPSFYLRPAVMQRHVLDDQVELWWSRQPRRSLMCYCVSVVLIMALGLGGVGLLSTSTSLSGEWRLGVGTTLCLLALAVLLKQLLSSAIQDMNCVRSRRRIEQLKSGGRADPALILTVGLAVMICGTALICVATVGGESHDGREMLVSGLLLLAGGSVMALSVGGYSALEYLKWRREQRRRRTTMVIISRSRRMENRAVGVYNMARRQTTPSRRETFLARTSLL